MRAMGQNEAHAAQYAQNHARLVAEKINEPISLDEQEIRLTASMGIAFYPSDAANGAELLKHVELAMAKAKESGRNSMHFFRPQMQSEAERRIYLEKEIRTGLTRNEFVIYLQPQVDNHRQLKGAESLVRWLHPDRGLIPPGEFIPAAEDTGLILDLGKEVLRQACRWLRQASELSHKKLPIISVNLSPRQFFEPDFVEKIRSLLKDESVDPGLLELEITEGLLFTDVDVAIERMCQLKDLGLKFSLDDFGTGYSSLSYLRRLPVDQIKIDQSFVRNVHLDERNGAIVRTIISLAGNLGMDTIAEGVEVIEELEFLQNAGCQQFQGYYFSKPIPTPDFEQQWLLKQEEA
jgi:EAL domain-containing protein (putative c-di-GMP-specific phosphodiesterase class I)